MLSFFRSLFGFQTPLSPAPIPVAARTPTVGPNIAIVNASTVISDAQLIAAVAALQIQIDRDFAPVWKLDANLVAVPAHGTIPAGSWVLYVLDTSDQAGALGYHDITAEGNPVGKVFAKDDIKYSLSWTVTLSHELMEMLADPWIQNCVFAQTTNTTGVLYALEVADACEADTLGYRINGVLVSDFVYPAWFEGFRKPHSTRFDHSGALTAPLQLAKGGYIGVFPVNPKTTGWTQEIDAEGAGVRFRIKGRYSRTMRRGQPLDLT